MAVEIDTSRAPRSPAELLALIRAVVAALPQDELDWVEWKSAADLTHKPTQGTIARHILGMANRVPEQAAQHVQGCGYLVVGAEPGSLVGLLPVDPAVLGQGVQPYLGDRGPAWSPQYVQDRGFTILVITVEPPQPGHPIFTLEKQFARSDGKIYPAGTVFVRRPGRTVQAEPGDIRALAERFAAPALATEAHARRMVEIEEARLAAEARDRERRWLTELSTLISAIVFKATPYRDSRGWFRCEEQMHIQALIADRDLLKLEKQMPSLVALSGAGQGMETFAAATRANIEIQAAMRNLAAPEAERG